MSGKNFSLPAHLIPTDRVWFGFRELRLLLVVLVRV